MIKREQDYALRICAYLAGNEKEGCIAVSKIAAELLITKPFATKIVYNLRNQNILKTVQGKDGGILLSRSPKDISILDVLIAAGFQVRLNECLDDNHSCPFENKCRIHKFFADQEQRLVDEFKNKTLADVAF